MPFIYHEPKTVINPKQFIKKVTVLYDGQVEGFSLAVIDWDGLDHVAMRWNVAVKEHEDMGKQSGKVTCNGSPSLNNIPSWFILPRELFNPVLFDEESEVFLNLVAKWPSNLNLLK